MTRSIDEWAADKCHVVAQEYVTCGVGDPESDNYYEIELPDGWTIRDPRCQEIFRNWWLSQYENRNGSVEFYPSGYVAYRRGTTDRYAYEVGEEACITAIYEAEK